MAELENQESDKLTEESALLKAYKTLEQNSVSKEKYENDVKELKEKNALYLKAITEGAEVQVDSKDEVSLEDKIKDISSFKGTNLDYWKKMTSTIDSVLKEVPEAEIVKVTGTDGLDEIIKVNEAMKTMVNDSNGNPDMFRTLYASRVMESAPRIASEIEKNGGLVNYLAKPKK